MLLNIKTPLNSVIQIIQSLVILCFALVDANASPHLLLIALLALRLNTLTLKTKSLNIGIDFNKLSLTPILSVILTAVLFKHFLLPQTLTAPEFYLDIVILLFSITALFYMENTSNNVSLGFNTYFSKEATIIAVITSTLLFLYKYYFPTSQLNLTLYLLIILIFYFDYIKSWLGSNTPSTAASYLTDQSKWLLVLFVIFTLIDNVFDIHSNYQLIFGLGAIALLIITMLLQQETSRPLKRVLPNVGHQRTATPQTLEQEFLEQVLLDKVNTTTAGTQKSSNWIMQLSLSLCLLPVLLDCCLTHNSEIYLQIKPQLYLLPLLTLLCFSYLQTLMLWITFRGQQAR